MPIFKNTITKKEDYFELKGVSLELELQGSTDDDGNAAERFIFRVENKIISWLTRNYDFNVNKINDITREKFICAVCEQIEEELMNGKHSMISESTISYLDMAGFMNLRRIGSYGN